MSWKEKRLITILSITFCGGCCALRFLLVLSVRYRGECRPRRRIPQTSASDISQAGSVRLHNPVNLSERDNAVSFALNEDGAWYWESEPDFP